MRATGAGPAIYTAERRLVTVDGPVPISAPLTREITTYRETALRPGEGFEMSDGRVYVAAPDGSLRRAGRDRRSKKQRRKEREEARWAAFTTEAADALLVEGASLEARDTFPRVAARADALDEATLDGFQRACEEDRLVAIQPHLLDAATESWPEGLYEEDRDAEAAP